MKNPVEFPINTRINTGNLVGEAWVYYWLYGVLELAITIFIITVAVKWPVEATSHAE